MHILSEQITYERGTFRCIRQYLAGHHPHLGRLHHGWSGPETIVERCFVVPLGVIRVRDTGEREWIRAAAD